MQINAVVILDVDIYRIVFNRSISHVKFACLLFQLSVKFVLILHMHTPLTHCDLVTPCGVMGMGQHWFGLWLRAVQQCWFIVNFTPFNNRIDIFHLTWHYRHNLFSTVDADDPVPIWREGVYKHHGAIGQWMHDRSVLSLIIWGALR